MAKNLYTLIKASGISSPVGGDSFDTDVPGSQTGVKVSDYLSTGASENVLAIIPQSPTVVPSGQTYNITYTLTGGARLTDILHIGAITRALELTSHPTQFQVDVLSRTGLSYTCRVTFVGALGSITGATLPAPTTIPSTLTNTDEIYRLVRTINLTGATGANTTVQYGFRVKPDIGGFNDEYTSPQYSTVVAGQTLDFNNYDYAWTSNNLAPNNGGVVLSTNRIFQEVGYFTLGTPSTSTLSGQTRYAWYKSKLDSSWTYVNSQTWFDPRV